MSRNDERARRSDGRVADDMDSGPLLARTRVKRRFLVHGLLGQGPIAQVYLAEMTEDSDPHSQGIGSASQDKAGPRTVALKVFLSEDTAREYLPGYEARARAAPVPSLASVLGALKLGQRHCVVEQYIEAVDFKSILAKGPIPARVGYEAILGIAQVLLQIQSTRPDLRPEHGGLRAAHVLLGARGDITLLGHGVAPAEKRGPFQKSDTWSLGALLYEMAVGKPLVQLPTEQEAYLQELEKAMALYWGSAWKPDEDLYRFVAEMLAFNPRERPFLNVVAQKLDALVKSLPGPGLRDWSMPIIRSLLVLARNLPRGEWTGRRFEERVGIVADEFSAPEPVVSLGKVEQGHSPSLGPTTVPVEDRIERPATAPGLDLKRLLLVGGAGLVILLGVGTGLWFAEPDDPLVQEAQAPEPSEPVAPSDAEPAQAATPETPPAAEPSATPPPEKEKPAPQATTAPGKARTEPSPKEKTPTKAPSTPHAAKAAPTADSSGKGTVHVSGDATEVVLIADGKRLRPGKVPAGNYTIEAVFGDSWPKQVGRVGVVSGRTVTIACDSGPETCSVR